MLVPALASPQFCQAKVEHAVNVWSLLDDVSRPLNPITVASGGGDLFFLTPQAVWKVPTGESLLEAGSAPGGASVAPALKAVCVGPRNQVVSGVPVHELTAAAYCQGRNSLVVLQFGLKLKLQNNFTDYQYFTLFFIS